MQDNRLRSSFKLTAKIGIKAETEADIQNVQNPDASHHNSWLWIYLSLKRRLDSNKNVRDIIKLAAWAQTFALY